MSSTFAKGKEFSSPGAVWGGGEAQGLGRRVQPAAAFKRSRCLRPQTASLNTEQGRELAASCLRTGHELAASTLRLFSHPSATSARHGQHPSGGCPCSKFGATHPICSPIPMGTHRGSERWSGASPAGAAREAGAGSSWPYMAIFAPLLQLPAAPHPKAGSGAGSQRLACLLPVNLFPAEQPPRGPCTTGMAVSCPDTTARTGQGGSANPVVVTKWVQPPSALRSDPLGPRQHPQFQGALRGSLHPCTCTLHVQHCWRGRGTEDVENIGTVMGTRASSHQDGGRGAALSRHPSSLGTKAKAQHCTGTCRPHHAEGTISQPCKPKN